MSSGLGTWPWLPSSAQILEQPWNPFTTWLNPALLILELCLLSPEWSDVAQLLAMTRPQSTILEGSVVLGVGSVPRYLTLPRAFRSQKAVPTTEMGSQGTSSIRSDYQHLPFPVEDRMDLLWFLG